MNGTPEARAEQAPQSAMFNGWRELRVDIEPGVAPDILADITDLSAIETGSVDAVIVLRHRVH